MVGIVVVVVGVVVVVVTVSVLHTYRQEGGTRKGEIFPE